MLSVLNTRDLVTSVEGKTYENKRVVKFTIKEVTENTKLQVLVVKCIDDEGSPYTFNFGASNANKKKLLYAFLLAFYSREDLLSNNVKPVELVGHTFEIRSDGPGEWEGKRYQRWNPAIRKVVAELASAEEFTQ